MEIGIQKARIVANYVGMNEKTKSIFVNLKLDIAGETGWTRIYMTEKSMGIARARLRKAGFDVDAQHLADLEQNEFLLAGREVEVSVYENEYQGKTSLKVDINLERKKLAAGLLDKLTNGLREVKKGEDSEDAEALNKQAEEEGIPF